MSSSTNDKTNNIAHTLTRVSILLASLTTYYNVPQCIKQLIINEML